jgi:hypothetical protein
MFMETLAYVPRWEQYYVAHDQTSSVTSAGPVGAKVHLSDRMIDMLFVVEAPYVNRFLS